MVKGINIACVCLRRCVSHAVTAARTVAALAASARRIPRARSRRRWRSRGARPSWRRRSCGITTLSSTAPTPSIRVSLYSFIFKCLITVQITKHFKFREIISNSRLLYIGNVNFFCSIYVFPNKPTFGLFTSRPDPWNPKIVLFLIQKKSILRSFNKKIKINEKLKFIIHFELVHFYPLKLILLILHNDNKITINTTLSTTSDKNKMNIIDRI